MSKLIDLISRLGQQSAQPIGFGALTGRVATAPTMALIGTAAADEFASVLGNGLPDGVDSVVVLSDEEAGAVPDLIESTTPDDLVWGVSGGSLSTDDLNQLIAAGCDYVLVASTAPASVVGDPDLGTIVIASGPVDRETGVALRSLRVDGSLNTSGLNSDGLNFGNLVDVVKVGASIGGVMLVSVSSSVSAADLAALRDAGVDGLVAPLGDTELIAKLAESIRALPPRRRPESRGLSPSAPRSES